MLGHMATTVLREAGHDIITIARKGPVDRAVDLEHSAALHDALQAVRPHWVINAAGKLNRAVDADMAASIHVNSVLPHQLAAWGRELEFRLLHVSTDCVFGGELGAYRVSVRTDATSAYGRSKALGEVVNDRDLTIRTSIIGPELAPGGTGLMLWFMRQAQSAPGWTAAIWTGLTTLELARVIEAVVTGRIAATGLWQCVPAAPISKHDLLRLMNDELRQGRIAVTPERGIAGNKSLINDRSALWPVPTYRRMLHDLRMWIDAHRALYAGTPFAQ
jgi:dTDP-4-dehydrorhamnose reductase